jgi:crotonobetainyl-CoA:carnitine CoA-transferase CaiB-like acyl-CoA transferase
MAVNTEFEGSNTLAYAGLKVIDASQGLAGPYCAMLLAQHGAEVIKIEPPTGDWARSLGTRYGDQSALALAANRGKKSIVLDMKNPGAVRAMARLCEGADVFLESFRPGVAAKLGLGYEALSASNPGLVYLSISGFGQSGPYAERPATDSVLQAYAGMMSLNRDSAGSPNRVGFLVVDTLTALYSFQAVAAALALRARTGAGKRLDVSLAQCAGAFVSQKVIEAALEGENPRVINAPAGSYRTADGWIIVGLSKHSHWERLCKVMNRPDLLAEPRYASFEKRADCLPELQAIVAAEIARQPSDWWLERLAAEDVLCNRVNTIGDWLQDEHAAVNAWAPRTEVPGAGTIPALAVPGAAPPAPDSARAAWPGLGEHTRAILAAHGCTQAEIDALLASGAAAQRA